MGTLPKVKWEMREAIRVTIGRRKQSLRGCWARGEWMSGYKNRQPKTREVKEKAKGRTWT